MKVINAQNVYSFVLDELEWYAGTEQQREAWVNQIMREAKEASCRYAAILVEPDAIMSMSPIARRHTVWRYSAPTSAEEDFRSSLVAVLSMHANDINAPRMRAIAREVFGE